MSFPSCIKIPTSKINASTETSSYSSNNEETITYDELISIANEVFGNGQWSHSITSQTVDYVEYVMGKYLIGCAAFVKVQRIDGTFHEALGYSYTESAVKGSAILSARTVCDNCGQILLSITQALRKALLCFAGTIQERINKSAVKAPRAKEKPSTPNHERINEASAGTRIREAGLKERASRLSSTEEICPPKRSAANQEQPVVSSKSNKSPKPIETDEIPPLVIDVGVEMESHMESLSALNREGQEPPKVPNNHNNLPHKDRSSAAMTDEEIRLERKRKQKQKQEEYKKLMMEKNIKSADKPNPKY